MENKTPEEILFDQIEIAKSKYPDENWMSSEEMLASPEFSFVINALKEYGKQQYNQALNDAANNAAIYFPKLMNIQRDAKEAILKLLK